MHAHTHIYIYSHVCVYIYIYIKKCILRQRGTSARAEHPLAAFATAPGAAKPAGKRPRTESLA